MNVSHQMMSQLFIKMDASTVAYCHWLKGTGIHSKPTETLIRGRGEEAQWRRRGGSMQEERWLNGSRRRGGSMVAYLTAYQ